MNRVGKGDLINSQFVVRVSACLSKISWNRSTYCIIIDILFKDEDGQLRPGNPEQRLGTYPSKISKKVQRSPVCVIDWRNNADFIRTRRTHTNVARQHYERDKPIERLSPFFLLLDFVSLSLSLSLVSFVITTFLRIITIKRGENERRKKITIGKCIKLPPPKKQGERQ